MNPDSQARLDMHVTGQIPELSRSSSAKIIEDGKVKVNGKTVKKVSYKVKDNDKISIDFNSSNFTVPTINIEIIYEDKDCIVISKPIGLLTHSKGSFNPEATAATWLSDKLDDLSGDRAGIVHRLDRATSGVMIVAKNQASLSWLQKQFSTRKVKKTYVAIVSGMLEKDEAIIDMPIERDPKAPATFRVGANGKKSLTHYKVVSHNNHYSLLELKPETGRTHQLRVHLNKIGHPIVGDSFYDGEKADRLFLHAISLELTLPDKQRKVFNVDMPKEFTRFMDKKNE